MPSTYSPDLRIELIANGEKTGTWGTITNSNLGTLIEDAISGLATVSITAAAQALTIQDGVYDEARNAAIAVTTTTLANFAVYVPPVTKLYTFTNSSAYVATVYASTVAGNTTAAGTGVIISAGKSVLLRCDGTNIVEQFNHVAGNLSIAGNTTVTGNATVTGTTTLLDDLILGASSGTTGQVVVSQGAGSAPIWGNAFVAGMILMWSGSIATIPTGWLLCDGTNSTPNLRDRFVVGAGSTYAVNATGGSADAVVVSHTHTASVTDPGHFHSGGRVSFLNNGIASGLNDTSSTPGNTGTNTTGISVTNALAGVSGTNANLPPYYALAYIMKA